MRQRARERKQGQKIFLTRQIWTPSGVLSRLRDILPLTFLILFDYIPLFLDAYLIDVLMRAHFELILGRLANIVRYEMLKRKGPQKLFKNFFWLISSTYGYDSIPLKHREH